jgi:hypothetical protein
MSSAWCRCCRSVKKRADESVRCFVLARGEKRTPSTGVALVHVPKLSTCVWCSYNAISSILPAVSWLGLRLPSPKLSHFAVVRSGLDVALRRPQEPSAVGSPLALVYVKNVQPGVLSQYTLHLSTDVIDFPSAPSGGTLSALAIAAHGAPCAIHSLVAKFHP